MARKAAALILWLPFFVTISTHAEIYKWVDPQGQIHYSDSPVGNAAPVDDTLPPASIFTLPPEAIPPAANPIPSAIALPPQATVPPPEGDFSDDAPREDQDPTVNENRPTPLETLEDIPQEENAEPPAVTADAPDGVLTPEVAPEDQFGPAAEFDNQPLEEENNQ